MNSNHLPVMIVIALCAVGAVDAMVRLARRLFNHRPPLDEIQNGCRTEYGPLELRIQATESVNRFKVYVEDHRLEQSRVSEEAVQSTLDSAKELLTLKAGKYLDGLKEAAQYKADWRCS